MTAAELIDFFQHRSSLIVTDEQNSCSASPHPSEVDEIMICDDQPVPLNHGPKGASGCSERLGPLTFVEVYDEKYLLAFPLVEGECKCFFCFSFCPWSVSSTMSCARIYTGNKIGLRNAARYDG
jgi:hypothetical protein